MIIKGVSFCMFQESALRCLQTKDLRLFTDIVNTQDDQGQDVFPLPAEHWINRDLEDKQGKTLLLEAINLHLHDYVDILLRAGARANLYSQELGTTPIHEAVKTSDLKSVKLLLGQPGNKADFRYMWLQYLQSTQDQKPRSQVS